MKKIIKTIGIVFLVFVLVVAGYVGYVLRLIIVYRINKKFPFANMRPMR